MILRCPKCRATKAVAPDEHDPRDAAICEIVCPICDDGDRHEPRFFRKDGTETLWSPEWARGEA